LRMPRRLLKGIPGNAASVSPEILCAASPNTVSRSATASRFSQFPEKSRHKTSYWPRSKKEMLSWFGNEDDTHIPIHVPR
jgi:hypothetical protein